MKVETQVITPEVAQKLLKKNQGNRPISLHMKAQFAKDMAEGRWKLNAETIKINGDKLIDGQHRLAACIAAKTPFVSLVAYDVPSDVFDTVDRGKGRTVADIFAIKGIKHASIVGAAAAAIHAYLSAGSFNAGGARRTSAGKLEELLSDWSEIHEAADFISKQKFLIKLVPPGLAAGLCAMMMRSDSALAKAFWSDLNDQTNTFSTVSVLRERLMNNKMAKAKLRRDDVAAIIIKTWNAVKDGKSLKILKWTNTGQNAEQMPLIN